MNLQLTEELFKMLESLFFSSKYITIGTKTRNLNIFFYINYQKLPKHHKILEFFNYLLSRFHRKYKSYLAFIILLCYNRMKLHVEFILKRQNSNLIASFFTTL